MKKRLISFFRYHHFHTNPSKDSHHGFIACLSHLEYLAGVEELSETGSIEESWKGIREAINSLDADHVNDLQNFCKIQIIRK